jgi:hypothetical protein
VVKPHRIAATVIYDAALLVSTLLSCRPESLKAASPSRIYECSFGFSKAAFRMGYRSSRL